MEPQLPTPELPKEYQQSPQERPQTSPEAPLAPPSVEQRPAISPEQQGREQQQSSGGGDPAWTAQPVAINPVAPPQPVVSPQAPPTSDDTPLTANDDDLIEKEWVDKAKKIIASTKDDPYLQEKEVSKLQADYLKKRYDKEIKITRE